MQRSGWGLNLPGNRRKSRDQPIGERCQCDKYRHPACSVRHVAQDGSLQGGAVQTANERNIFLSTTLASSRDRRVALAVVGVSAALFACAVPFATVPLTPVPAFVASYQSMLALNDLITAILLYSQFGLLRSRSLLLLASGYLFTAVAAIVHLMTYPGVFAQAGLLGAGPQTTAWLYMVWHGGFPLLVLGYALLKARDNEPKVKGSTAAAIVASIVAVSVAMAAFTWLVTAQHDRLPILLSGGQYTPVMLGVVSTVWCLSFAALTVQWPRRQHYVLDVG